MTLAAGTVSQVDAPPARLGRLPGLDGLRAIAVTAVIIYHLNPSWLPGGFLGVDVFFVISGYLITALLLAEHTRTSRISLKDFWARRARRLLPAVVALLAVVTLLASLFARDGLGRLRVDIPASLFYVMNWRLVFQHVSYMATFGRPPLLEHLWSLSVEEQFYLLWPLALVWLRRRSGANRVALVAAVAAAVSAGLMAVLFQPNDPSAVYFGTDTHAEGLLLGCALAAAVPPWRMSESVTPTARRLLERSGVAALALVVVGMAVLGFSSPATYRGGMLLVDIATAVVVATVAHPASRLGSVLGRQPLRWAGLRSYSLYLWHWPIFELTRPGVDISLTGWPSVVLRLGLTALGAELSYRLVESPWRSGRAQAWLRVHLLGVSRPATAAVAAIPVGGLVAMLATAPGSSVPAILREGATPAARSAPVTAVATRRLTVGSRADLSGGSPPPPPPTTLPPPPPSTTVAPSSTTVAPSSTTVAPPSTTVAPPTIPISESEPVLAIGDSVMLAASPAMQDAFGPAITVDAQVGRQVDAGLARLAQYRSSGALAGYRTVVIDLGTNGAFTPAEFDEMTSLVSGVPRVIVYDVHAARSWTGPDNAVIAAGVAAHPGQMQMVDWNGAAKSSLLYGDGVHPNLDGADVYTQLLEAALSTPPGR